MRLVISFILLVGLYSCSSSNKKDGFVNYSTANDWVGCQLEADEIQQVMQAYLANEQVDFERLYCVYKRVGIGKKRVELAKKKEEKINFDSLYIQNPFALDVLNAFRLESAAKQDAVRSKKLSKQMVTLVKAMLNQGRGASVEEPLVVAHINDIRIILDKRFDAKVLDQKRIFNSRGLPCVQLELENEKQGKFLFYYSMLPEVDLGSLE